MTYKVKIGDSVSGERVFTEHNCSTVDEAFKVAGIDDGHPQVINDLKKCLKDEGSLMFGPPDLLNGGDGQTALILAVEEN